MLKVENIEAGYGDFPVLRGVSVTIERNESVAIIGANGAGKTTLVRAICGLMPISAGRIMRDDAAIHHLPAHQRSKHGIAVVLEGRHLFGELPVRANLQLAAVYGQQRAVSGKRFGVDDVLDLFPFMKGRLEAPVELLSGGEQQMVAVARALLLQPDLLILDEPSTGLSPKVVRDIVGVLATLRKGGMSILLVEQNVALAAQTSDRAYVMSLGKVVHEIKHGEWEGFGQNEALIKAYLGGTA